MTIEQTITSPLNSCPTFGRSVIEAGQTLHLLVANPDRPDTWWAWNPTSCTLELVTPPEELMSEGSDPNVLLQAVVASHRDVQERLQTAERQLNQLQNTIGQIRDYAVERHEGGDICLQGLREFLEHFGLDTYPTQIEVDISVHGTATINASNVESALNRIRFLIDGFEFSGDEPDDAVEFYLGSVDVEPRES